jgi:hypothetical protein
MQMTPGERKVCRTIEREHDSDCMRLPSIRVTWSEVHQPHADL